MPVLLSRCHFATVMYPPPQHKSDDVRNAYEVIGVKFSRGIEAEASTTNVVDILRRSVSEEFRSCVFEVEKKRDGRMIMRLIVPTRGGVTDLGGTAYRLMKAIREAVLVNAEVRMFERDVIENTLSYVHTE